MIELGPDVGRWVRGFIERVELPSSYEETARAFYVPLAGRIERLVGRMKHVPVVGINGGQGTGKSTCSALVAGLLELRGLRPLVLSIDDFYFSKAKRQALAADTHPLLKTRGVPGTHDMELFRHVVEVIRGEIDDPALTIPRFDKGADDRVAEGEPLPPDGVDVILFEGWCVGATAQPNDQLAVAINALEQTADADGVWRAFVNQQLAGPYADAFEVLDYLVMLRPPRFEVIYAWRAEQEERLGQRLESSGRSTESVMDASGLAAFIAHYERLTRWMFEDLPGRVDESFLIDERHEVFARAHHPERPTRYLVSTDLDASLLDEHYDWRAALPALGALAEVNALLVLNSSKTIREMKPLAAELVVETGMAPPILVGENGGMLAVPRVGGGYQTACLGRERRTILACAHRARAERGYAFEGFADWTPEEVMRQTGLSREAAGMAMDRESTEPICWNDSEAHWSAFRAELEEEGLRAVRGGRFVHLMGQRADKAYGLTAALAHVREKERCAWTVVAVGDSPNDVGMLAAADIAVVIPNPASAERIDPAAPRRVFPSRPGPEGWNEALLTILEDNA